MKAISLKEVEYVAHSLAKKTMKWDEPIPEFNTRFPNKLESCIITPFLKFNNQVFYKGLNGKAAILFYLMIKNHPFQNGNKRIAIMTLLYFLYKNGKWLNISNHDLYNFSLSIAKSKPTSREKTIFDIQENIKKYLINFEV